MRSVDLAQIVAAGVLIIAELERTARAGISQVGHTGDLERWNARIIRTDPIRAGDLQHIGSEISVLDVPIRSDVLARIAGVAVHENGRRQSISEAGGGALYPPAGVAGVTPIKPITSGRAEHLGSDNVHRRL